MGQLDFHIWRFIIVRVVNLSSMLQIVAIIVLLNFLSFAWSVIGVFRKVEDQDRLMYRLLQLNSVLIWSLGGYLVVTQDLWLWQAVVLAGIQLFCLGTFWSLSRIVKRNSFSIVFSRDVPTQLVRQGLYNWIRHPFYMVYLLSYFSLSIVCQNFLLLLLSVSITLLYYRAAKAEEAKFLNSSLAAEYREYQNRTFKFLPKFWSRKRVI